MKLPPRDVLARQCTAARTLGKRCDLLPDGGNGFRIGTAHDRRDQAIVGRHGNGDVRVRVANDLVTLESRVERRVPQQCERAGAHDKIVDRDAALGGKLALAREEGPCVDLDRQPVVRNRLLGLEQSSRNDRASGAHFDPRLSVGARGLATRRSGRSRFGGIGLHVFLGDPPVATGALHLRDVDAELLGQSPRDRAHALFRFSGGLDRVRLEQTPARAARHPARTTPSRP